MEDGHTLACVHKLCVDLSQAEFVEIKACIKATRSEHVAEVVVKVEIGENVGSLFLCQMLQTIALPDLNLKDTEHALFLLILNCLDHLHDLITLLYVQPSQRRSGQL